jgi:hypothetical protein
MASRLKFPLVCLACVLAVAGFVFFKVWGEYDAISAFKMEIAAKKDYTNEVAAYKKLLSAVGGIQAQEILFATIPNDTVGHMINHETGLYFYKTEGMKGLSECKDYFTYSCYHGFFAAMTLDRGLSDLPAIAKICAGESDRNTQLQCAHGVGHGLLDSVGYQELPQALALCKETFSSDKAEISLCFDGIAMENNRPPFTVPPPDHWYEASDPMYPCDAPEIVSLGAHNSCWHTQSYNLLRAAAYPQIGGDVGKAERYCDSLSDQNDAHICRVGIGRSLFARVGFDIQNARATCAPASDLVSCVWFVARSMYYFGDRASDLLGICENESGARKDTCYHEALFNAITITYQGTDERVSVCKQIPETQYANACVAWMSTGDPSSTI